MTSIRTSSHLDSASITLGNQNDDAASTTIHTQLPHRLTMDTYLLHPATAPPSYDHALAPSSLKPTRFNIQPRPDEGHESLPPYSCSLSLQNVFLWKMELEGAIHQAADREWKRVVVSLQGTALNFYKVRGGGLFGRKRKGDDGEMEKERGGGKGGLIRSYNLQFAEVGIAADYTKKKHTLRLRCETDQFLLSPSISSLSTFILWLQSLSLAIDLAPPLDDREIPRDLSIPRPRRRRERCGAVREENREGGYLEGLETNDILVREQEGIMRTQYPRLAQQASQTITTMTFDGTRGVIHASPRIPSRPKPSPATNLTPDGKWAPPHFWTANYDMLYAKRCMAILLSRSPRKSNLVIMKGRQWIVDWETGDLKRVGPPEYGEVTEMDRKMRRASWKGSLARDERKGSLCGGQDDVYRINHFGDVVKVGGQWGGAGK